MTKNSAEVYMEVRTLLDRVANSMASGPTFKTKIDTEFLANAVTELHRVVADEVRERENAERFRVLHSAQ